MKSVEHFLEDGPKVVACLVIPVYAGLIGASVGGFLLYAVATGIALTLGERFVEKLGGSEVTEIAVCVAFWFGLAVNFGLPAFGLGRLFACLI